MQHCHGYGVFYYIKQIVYNKYVIVLNAYMFPCLGGYYFSFSLSL